MSACSWILVAVALGLGQQPPADTPGTTADAVTLRDGKVLLGHVVESGDRRAPLVVLARRAWVNANLPEHAATWEKAESATTRQAEHQRLERLKAWRHGQPNPVDPNDRITPWLDAEIARLSAPAGGQPDAKPAPAPSDLMIVRLSRTAIKGLIRKPKPTGRLLRLAWTMHLADPETASVADLTQAIEDKGFSAASDSAVALDSLLPIPLETEELWITRRAATELNNLSGGRFLVFGNSVMPDVTAGEAPPVNAGLDALGSTLKDLLGDGGPKPNPLLPKLRELGNQGRVGALVTGMEMSPDMASTTVTTTLWLNPGNGRDWVPELNRSSTVRPGDLPANAGAGLAEDPQVKAAFDAVASLGLGEIPAEMKQRSLNMGSATQKALGDARTAIRTELNALAMPLDLPKTSEPAAKP